MDRADESLRTLQDEFQAFVHAKPVAVRFELDVQSEWHTAYIECAEPPMRLGVLAGESIYQMRSSLEHVVWAMVKANKKKPGRHNTFPIRLNPYQNPFWKEVRASCLRGVPKAAATLIEKLQPYNAPHPFAPREHFLAALNDLASEDRHRTLHGTFVWTNPQKIEPLFVANRMAQIVDLRILTRGDRQPIVDGAQIARVRIKPLARNAKVEVKGNLPVVIAFGNRSEVAPLTYLYQLSRDVRKALSLFQPFL